MRTLRLGEDLPWALFPGLLTSLLGERRLGLGSLRSGGEVEDVFKVEWK